MQELKFGVLCDAQKRANEGRKFLAWKFHVLPLPPSPIPTVLGERRNIYRRNYLDRSERRKKHGPARTERERNQRLENWPGQTIDKIVLVLSFQVIW
jgi:hypothetical protein